MSWFSQLFSKPKKTKETSNSTSYHDFDSKPIPLLPTKSNLQNAKDIVKRAALKTVQAHGIPADWLAFEVITIADTKNAYFQLQVEIKVWDEHLVLHTLGFQNAVIKRVRDADLEVGRALRAVLWRMSPDAGCPYDEMPPAQAWAADSIRIRSIARERMNRELKAMQAPASGAAVPSDKKASTGEGAPEKKSSKFEGLLDDDDSSVSQSSRFDGFAATQPFGRSSQSSSFDDFPATEPHKLPDKQQQATAKDATK
jgi:hypothetical protein